VCQSAGSGVACTVVGFEGTNIVMEIGWVVDGGGSGLSKSDLNKIWSYSYQEMIRALIRAVDAV
jgi:hypothetical protein